MMESVRGRDDAPDMRRVVGSCLCGAVSVELRAATGTLVYCHCAQCRKTAGSAFIAVLPVAGAAVTVRDPLACIREYRATPGKSRHFCRRCGSPLFSRRDGVDGLRVRAGLFAELPGVTHGGHIFAAAAAPWDLITDALPRHARFEPARSGAVVQPERGQP